MENQYQAPALTDNLSPNPTKKNASLNTPSMRVVLPVGRSKWAIYAGYLALISILIFPGPLALVVSIMAIVDIQKSKQTTEPKYGMGRAIFGLIMGLAGTAILADAYLLGN